MPLEETAFMSVRATKQIALAALCGASLSMSGCGGDGAQKEAATQASALPSGERLKLSPSTIEEVKEVGASVTTKDIADARARIPGVLVSLSIREGDFVRKGQKIGSVVDSRLGYEASAYGAQAAAAQAQAASAQAELERTRFLVRNGVYAKARLDQAEATARAANAQISAARAQQAAVSSIAGQGAILSPATGRVLRTDVPAGSAVSPGVSVATITSGPTVLRLDLPETLAGRVRRGTRVVATGLTTDPGIKPPVGTITQIYPAVAGGRITADVDIAGLGTELVGRQITVRVETGARTALIVPKRFVQTRFGVDQVTILTADKQVMTVPVQTAPHDATSVEILSGAIAGDTLVAVANTASQAAAR